uniref:hypothetical protein n=1 Tax=Pseudonocardia sp. CA-138482 TaxID=3240023 RepID=UPI003F499DBA
MDLAEVAALFDVLCERSGRAGPARREPMRCWQLSSVERVAFADGSSAVFKCASAPFEREPEILAHAAASGLPVPQLIAAVRRPGAAGMLLEDLGDPLRDATLDEAAAMAVAVHAAEPTPGLPLLDATALAGLPSAGLAALDALRAEGRWSGTDDVRDDLARLDALVKQRVEGADTPPFGLCHSEFHPTSIHVGARGARVLDFARAFVGPGLLDLASWSGTTEAPDLPALRELLAAYVGAAGTAEVFADRGGLPAERWAVGMHRLWVIGWYLEQQIRWMPYPSLDPDYQPVVRRHLAEALECLS